MKLITALLIIGLMTVSIALSGAVISPSLDVELDKGDFDKLKEATGSNTPDLEIDIICNDDQTDCYFNAYLPNVINSEHNKIHDVNKTTDEMMEVIKVKLNAKVIAYLLPDNAPTITVDTDVIEYREKQ